MIIYLSPSNQNKIIEKDVIEKDFTRNICNKLKEKLENDENLTYICNEKNTVDDNIEESELVNADIYVCVHISKNLSKKISVVCNDNSLSKKLSRNILQQLKLVYKINNLNNDIQKDANIIEVKKSYIPITFIEFPGDEESIKWLKNYKEDIVDAMYRGITIYNKDKS